MYNFGIYNEYIIIITSISANIVATYNIRKKEINQPFFSSKDTEDDNYEKRKKFFKLAGIYLFLLFHMLLSSDLYTKLTGNYDDFNYGMLFYSIGINIGSFIGNSIIYSEKVFQ